MEEQIKKTNQQTVVNKRTDLSVSSPKNSQIQGCKNNKDCSAVRTVYPTFINALLIIFIYL